MEAALYCRLSRPGPGQVATVAEQERALRGEAARRGLNVVGVFVDDGISAWDTTRVRPGWLELLAVVRTGDVSAVLTVAVDRLARRLGDLSLLIAAAELAGVVIISDGRELDLAADEGAVALLQIQGVFAEYESRARSRRLRTAKRIAAEQGRPAGGRRTFGYRIPAAAPGTLQIVEHEADAIRWAAHAIIDGATLREVAGEWNRRGHRTPVAGRPWDASRVHDVLTLPKLAGLRPHHGALFPATWAPILSSELQTRMRAALAARSRGSRLRRVDPIRPSLLGGIIHCGRCGFPLRPSRSVHRAQYACSQRGNGSCGGVAIDLAHTDRFVGELLTDRPRPERQSATASELEARLDELDQVDAEIRDLAHRYADREVVADAWQIANRGLMVRRAQLRARIAERLDADAPPTNPDAWDQLEPSRQRAIAATCIERIDVGRSTVGRRWSSARLQIRWAGEPPGRAG